MNNTRGTKMRNIPGCEIPQLRRKAIERLTQNIQDQSQEIERFKEVLATMEAELDLARVTRFILEQQEN